jgi:LysR family transcriptional regulator, hydrogen peroxide-inducible genes activator
MDLHHVRYFLAVCETLNFTKAADNCHVSQPALSRAIQQLEVEVGGLLFRRERSLTHLTDLGNLMKPHFEHIMGEVGDVKREARRFLTLEQASLNLGIMCTIAPTRFTGLLGSFAHAFPGVSIRMSEGIPAKLNTELESGEIDVALMASATGFPERCNFEVLYKERFVIAFPSGHRFARMSSIPIAAIDGENYLRRINCEYRDRLSELADACKADVHLGYASEREDWIQNMVAGGLGICFIPEFSAVLPGIQIRPVIDPEVWREVCLVTMAGRRHSPAVASFVKSLRGVSFPESRFIGGAAATAGQETKFRDAGST